MRGMGTFSSSANGVLLVTGGHGWGSGVRGGNAGHSLYWHVITPQNWSSPPILNEVFNVFANPGVENVHLRVDEFMSQIRQPTSYSIRDDAGKLLSLRSIA